MGTMVNLRIVLQYQHRLSRGLGFGLNCIILARHFGSRPVHFSILACTVLGKPQNRQGLQGRFHIHQIRTRALRER